MKRYIEISVVEKNPDGSPSQLVTLDLPDQATQRKYYRLLKLLSDAEILAGAPFEIPRGDKGSWIIFGLGDRHAVGQFNKGNPKFWDQGLRLGTLCVARIMTPEEMNRLIEQGRNPLT
ncbi:hypothetical protein [Sinomonas sp. RB5]